MDPYAVLGVDRKASMDEVKRAYRELAAKYHPDKYQGHELADLAQEKMKEINEAYDTIVRQREHGGNGSYTSDQAGGTPWGSGGGGTGAYAAVRDLISRGRLEEAEAMLSGKTRDAEWYFLMGSIAYRRGWFDEAEANWRNAVSMDPGNPEYQQAYRFSRQEPGRGAYRGGSAGGMDSDLCNCCSALICADCLCGCCR